MNYFVVYAYRNEDGKSAVTNTELSRNSTKIIGEKDIRDMEEQIRVRDKHEHVIIMQWPVPFDIV